MRSQLHSLATQVSFTVLPQKSASQSCHRSQLHSLATQFQWRYDEANKEPHNTRTERLLHWRWAARAEVRGPLEASYCKSCNKGGPDLSAHCTQRKSVIPGTAITEVDLTQSNYRAVNYITFCLLDQLGASPSL